MDHEETTC